MKEEINNTRMVWFNTLSDDDHTSCDLLGRLQIESTIYGKMLKNDVVDNEDIHLKLQGPQRTIVFYTLFVS